MARPVLVSVPLPGVCPFGLDKLCGKGCPAGFRTPTRGMSFRTQLKAAVADVKVSVPLPGVCPFGLGMLNMMPQDLVSVPLPGVCPFGQWRKVSSCISEMFPYPYQGLCPFGHSNNPVNPVCLFPYPYQGYVLSDSSLLKSFRILLFQTENSGPLQNSAHICVHWPEVQMKFSILPFFHPNQLYNKRRFIVNIFLFLLSHHTILPGIFQPVNFNKPGFEI